MKTQTTHFDENTIRQILKANAPVTHNLSIIGAPLFAKGHTWRIGGADYSYGSELEVSRLRKLRIATLDVVEYNFKHKASC